MDVQSDAERLRDYWRFGPERCHILLAVARSKDNDGLRATDQPTIREIVEDESELEDKIDQLEHATRRFDHRYRLYASVNARNAVTGFRLLQDRMTEWWYKALRGDEDVKANLKRVGHEWQSILQTPECRDDKRFLFDFDDVSEAEYESARRMLQEATEIVLETETPNGYHVVTEPFDYTELALEATYELKKDDMFFVRYLE